MEEYGQCYDPDTVAKWLHPKGHILHSHWHNETTDALRLCWFVCPRNNRILLVKTNMLKMSPERESKLCGICWTGQCLWALDQGCSCIFQHHPKMTIWKLPSLMSILWSAPREELASPTSFFRTFRASQHLSWVASHLPHSWFLNLLLWIFPETVFGSSETKATWRSNKQITITLRNHNFPEGLMSWLITFTTSLESSHNLGFSPC